MREAWVRRRGRGEQGGWGYITKSSQFHALDVDLYKKKIVGDIFLLTKRVSYSLVLTAATSHLSKLTQRFPAEIGPQ